MSQVVLLGIVCFCVPGTWNAVTSMAGGIRDKTVVSEATSLLYGAFTVCSLVAPVVCNILGPRVTLFLGTLGYIGYVVALWVYPRLDGALGRDLVVGTGAANGVSAALLWTAQGALIMSYPSSSSRGHHLSAFWVIFNLGAVFGGLVSFGFNFNRAHPVDRQQGLPPEEMADQQTATPVTMLAFACVMAFGAATTALLQPLSRVIRPDGSLVGSAPAGSPRSSFSSTRTAPTAPTAPTVTTSTTTNPRAPAAAAAAAAPAPLEPPPVANDDSDRFLDDADGAVGAWSALLGELGGMVRVCVQPQMLALAPLFLYSNWFYAYQFACFNAALFSARTQGLNSAFYWAAQMAGAMLVGAFLDSQRIPVRRRALTSLVGIGGLTAVSWGLGLWAQFFYNLDNRPCAAARAFNATAPAWCANATDGWGAGNWKWCGNATDGWWTFNGWWWGGWWCNVSDAEWTEESYDPYSYGQFSYEAWENGSYSYYSDWSYSYGYGDDNGDEPYDALDVASFDVVLAPGLLYVLWGFCDAVVQCWAYWLLGQLDDTPGALARSAGYYKALQSAGGAASWALSVETSGVPPSSQALINVGLALLAFPLALMAVVRELPEDDDWLEPHHPAHLRSGGHRLHSQPQPQPQLQPQPPAHRQNPPHRHHRGSGGRHSGSGSGSCSPGGRSSGGGERRRRVTREEIAQLPDFSDNLPADYRSGYMAWRLGQPRGAKGEVEGENAGWLRPGHLPRLRTQPLPTVDEDRVTR